MGTQERRTEMIKASDGVELYVETQGEGTPIVFSCGYCTTHENWRPQVNALVAAGAQVVLHDFRGHGLSQSPVDAASYSMEQVIDDLARVVEWTSPDAPVVLAGHSFGGLASLHLTAKQPERVRGLVLLATGPGFKNPDAAQKWVEQCERTARFLEERGLEAFLAGRAGETCVGRKPELPGAVAAAAAIAKQDVSGLAFFGRQVAGTAPPIMDELAGIDCPALVLVGEEDKAYLRAADVMQAKLANARSEALPGIGHVANLEDPEAFNALVVEFVKSL
ncbi:MAG: pimeloyl-ACP methyl ester carboxylesterase [Myxococcota bacterium]